MKKKDLIIYFIIVVFFICSLFVFSGSDRATDIVRVYVDKKLIAEYSIYEDGVYAIDGFNDISLELVIDNCEAFVRKSSCRDKICQSSGKISKSNESIICLPGRIVIEMFADDTSEYDTISR